MGQKHRTFREFGRHFPALYPQKSTQHVCACAAHDGAICSKNRKIVPYHRDSPNTRNSARLRSPSPIMAPADNYSTYSTIVLLKTQSNYPGNYKKLNEIEIKAPKNIAHTLNIFEERSTMAHIP